MCRDKTRVYHLDDDFVEVQFYFDEELNMFFGEYPDFTEKPRYTPNGRPWVNVTYTDCPYSSEDYDDCGSCEHFFRENPRDLIGICNNESLRKEIKL